MNLRHPRHLRLKNHTAKLSFNSCNLLKQKHYMKKIECIIMDWAGTSVDYGCFAPVAAFVESFKAAGIEVTPAETRAYMGLTKIEEIPCLVQQSPASAKPSVPSMAATIRMPTCRNAMPSSSASCLPRWRTMPSPFPVCREVIADLRARGYQGRFYHGLYEADDGRGHPCR